MKKCPVLLLFIVLSTIISSGETAGQAFRGEGDFEFFVDAGSLPMKDGRILELFQIAIPTREIGYEMKDGSWKAAVSVHLVLKDGERKIHEKLLMIQDSREAPPSADDLAGFLYIADSCTVDPGEYGMDVRIEDKNRRKKTLVGLLRNKYQYSFVENAGVSIRPFTEGEINISEPFMIWDRKEDGQFIPNPIRIYGLKNDTLSFFVHAILPEADPVDSVGVILTVTDDKEMVVDSMDARYPARNGKVTVFGNFDVNEYPAGSYRLNVEMMDLLGGYASSSKDFTIAWELLNWKRPRRDILLEARIMFNDEDFQKFEQASIGEQENIMNDFWKKIDPTPHTAKNENYELFLGRVHYADTHFGDNRRGAITDRGLTYIKYGPPDDIIQESVPFNRTDLDEVVDKLDDEYKVVIHKTWKGLGTEDAQVYNLTGSRSRAYRGGGMDTGGYELWVYAMKGKPIFERDDVMTVQSGIRFLFVDKDGVGFYVLVGTSEDINGQDQQQSTE